MAAYDIALQETLEELDGFLEAKANLKTAINNLLVVIDDEELNDSIRAQGLTVPIGSERLKEYYKYLDVMLGDLSATTTATSVPYYGGNVTVTQHRKGVKDYVETLSGLSGGSWSPVAGKDSTFSRTYTVSRSTSSSVTNLTASYSGTNLFNKPLSAEISVPQDPMPDLVMTSEKDMSFPWSSSTEANTPVRNDASLSSDRKYGSSTRACITDISKGDWIASASALATMVSIRVKDNYGDVRTGVVTVNYAGYNGVSRSFSIPVTQDAYDGIRFNVNPDKEYNITGLAVAEHGVLSEDYAVELHWLSDVGDDSLNLRWSELGPIVDGFMEAWAGRLQDVELVMITEEYGPIFMQVSDEQIVKMAHEVYCEFNVD